MLQRTLLALLTFAKVTFNCIQLLVPLMIPAIPLPAQLRVIVLVVVSTEEVLSPFFRVLLRVASKSYQTCLRRLMDFFVLDVSAN